ncbi:MAG: 4Fe-4S binding protein [Candidatus Heimdallarchaeota archaeon]|nr:4Fe-4S binding protein [Candidatus Heimdallarchaeota archaeon]MCK4768884.1 4Fe-4S binding protein [Candidatus Heimdallarchaeota archaeon]
MKKVLVMGGEALKNLAKGPVTKHVLKRIADHPPPEDIRTIPRIIEARCIMCGTCVTVCPTHCLGMEKDDKDNGMIWLQRAQCMWCGHCQTYCPKDAIHIDREPALSNSLFSFNNRQDYEMICASGSYKEEKADKKLEDLIEEGGKKLKYLEEFRG